MVTNVLGQEIRIVKETDENDNLMGVERYLEDKAHGIHYRREDLDPEGIAEKYDYYLHGDLVGSEYRENGQLIDSFGSQLPQDYWLQAQLVNDHIIIPCDDKWETRKKQLRKLLGPLYFTIHQQLRENYQEGRKLQLVNIGSHLAIVF